MMKKALIALSYSALILSYASASQAATQEKLLANSKKQGAKIYAVKDAKGVWCNESLSLNVRLTSGSPLLKTGINGLLQVLPLVLENECPRANTATIHTFVEKMELGSVLVASRDNGWIATQAPAAPVVVQTSPTPVIQGAPTTPITSGVTAPAVVAAAPLSQTPVTAPAPSPATVATITPAIPTPPASIIETPAVSSVVPAQIATTPTPALEQPVIATAVPLAPATSVDPAPTPTAPLIAAMPAVILPTVTPSSAPTTAQAAEQPPLVAAPVIAPAPSIAITAPVEPPVTITPAPPAPVAAAPTTPAATSTGGQDVLQGLAATAETYAKKEEERLKCVELQQAWGKGKNYYEGAKNMTIADRLSVIGNISNRYGQGSRDRTSLPGAAAAAVISGKPVKALAFVRVDGSKGDGFAVDWPTEASLKDQSGAIKSDGLYLVTGSVSPTESTLGDGSPPVAHMIVEQAVGCAQADCSDIQDPAGFTRAVLKQPDWNPDAQPTCSSN